MADLEELGLLEQPHTSAGRQPTSLGYRVYVDDLMEEKRLTAQEKKLIAGSVRQPQADIRIILERASILLSRMSNLLGVVLSPVFDKGVLHKIDLTKIAANRLLVILTIKSGLVKTITLEINFELENSELEAASRILNQRLGGLSLKAIREQISDRVCELPPDSRRDLITLFVDNAQQFFDFQEDRQFYLVGLRTLLSQPEFSQIEKLQTIIELMEDKKVLVHLIGETQPEDGVRITIGRENPLRRPLDISIVTSAFYIGENIGRMGIIGPTRMDYSKLLSVVDYTAKTIEKYFK